jgi:PIN domain nuclease of toxin-antitoxin system
VILFDTHALLWWLADEPLEQHAASAIADPSNRVLVSAVSVFEIESKRRLGKLRAPDDVAGAIAQAGFDQAVLRADEASLAGRLDWEHRDPFDRLLVAQSRVRGWSLYTGDATILAFEPRAVDVRRSRRQRRGTR